MIDVHAHILPHMDDGSRSTSESLAMLEESTKQGINLVAATPHFYAQENSPEEFLKRRGRSAARLQERWCPGLPELRLGAEVFWFEGMSRWEGLESLCIEDTELLLLEMPFAPWTERQLREVRAVAGRPGITVLLAHIERYLRWQTAEAWDVLVGWGVKCQCNAEFFLHWRTRRRALQMLRGGKIHFLGSDCHNMDSRPPRLGEVLPQLRKEDLRLLWQNWEDVAK